MDNVEVDGAGGSASATTEHSQAKHSRPYTRSFSRRNSRPIFLTYFLTMLPTNVPTRSKIASRPTKKTYKSSHPVPSTKCRPGHLPIQFPYRGKETGALITTCASGRPIIAPPSCGAGDTVPSGIPQCLRPRETCPWKSPACVCFVCFPPPTA